MSKNKDKSAKKVRTLRRDETTAHLDMLNLCYAPWGSEEEWRRRYIQHPDFDITENVVVIEDNGEWAGGGTGWLRRAFLKNNKDIAIYGAGDLYVHPDHRGKGIYSDAMRSLNQLAQKKGAVLGFAYPSIYRLPAMALPKYGFVELFYPTTHVLVLNPEKFFQFLISRAEKALLPEKFNGVKLKLSVTFATPKGKQEITKQFQVVNGEIHELQEIQQENSIDLAVKTDVSVLLHLVSDFFLGKRNNLLLYMTTNLLKRHLKIRFSMKLVRLYLGL